MEGNKASEERKENLVKQETWEVGSRRLRKVSGGAAASLSNQKSVQ